MKEHSPSHEPTASKTNANQASFLKQPKQEPFFAPKGSKSSFFKPNFNDPLLQRKKNEHLPTDLQSNMEDSFGHDFSGVAVHKDSTKATELNARAFTQGETVHFAPGEFSPGTESGKNLIGHEFTHVVQQRSGVVNPTSVMGKGISLNDDAGLEQEADHLGQKAVQGEHISAYRSAGLGIRNALRTPVQAKSKVIQRDIKGSKDLKNGKMELDFKQNDATVAGALAYEKGTVKFTPNAAAPVSNNIRLIQIVRTTDVSGITSKKGEPIEWSKVGHGEDAGRNKMMTTANNDKKISGGFYIDHFAGKYNPRTKKTDAAVPPYYRDYAPNAAFSQDGYKNKTGIQPASLFDRPASPIPIKFDFVTSAKGADTGTWYGSAVWGFEVYLDKGKAKIKGEHSSFRDEPGATTNAALKKFNEFYKNPGTPGAPTK